MSYVVAAVRGGKSLSLRRFGAQAAYATKRRLVAMGWAVKVWPLSAVVNGEIG